MIKNTDIRVIDVLNSNDFGLIAEKDNSHYLMAIDGVNPADLNYATVINGVLYGQFKSVYYDNSKWLATGQDQYQNNQKLL